MWKTKKKTWVCLPLYKKAFGVGQKATNYILKRLQKIYLVNVETKYKNQPFKHETFS